MIHIVDYGLGNIRAFMTMYRRLGFEVVRARTEDELRDASKIILPGVGAFDYAMQSLNDSGMRGMLDKLVVEDRVPVLGICVGMQILADSSEEGKEAGLGWVPGRVRSFSSVPDSCALPMPHMGWNDVGPLEDDGVFKGLQNDSRFYFLHSYFFECEHSSDASARTLYGLEFDCAVRRGNVYGVQFHPEKSHDWGAALLKNFAEL